MMREKNKEAIVLDDHQLFTDSFSALLEKSQMFLTVHLETVPTEFIEYLIRNPKKEIYLFLDYYLGDKLGIEIINDIRRINKKVRIIIVSVVSNPGIIQQIKSYEPEGIISKASGFDVILDCIQNIERGQTYYCPVINEIIRESSEVVVFTLREIEVLKYFAKGLSIAETGQKLFISKHTVVSHRRKMMKKTNSKTIIELLVYARNYGIIVD